MKLDFKKLEFLASFLDFVKIQNKKTITKLPETDIVFKKFAANISKKNSY